MHDHIQFGADLGNHHAEEVHCTEGAAIARPCGAESRNQSDGPTIQARARQS